MTHRRSALLIAGMLLVTGCAALPALLGLATAAAPVAVSALDYAARQAPGAPPADLKEIAHRLDVLERCDAAAHAVTAPDAGASDTQALIDAAAALRGLTDAIEHARAVAAAGKDGGT